MFQSPAVGPSTNIIAWSWTPARSPTCQPWSSPRCPVSRTGWRGASERVSLPWFHPATTTASDLQPKGEAKAGGGRFSGYWKGVWLPSITRRLRPCCASGQGSARPRSGVPQSLCLCEKVCTWLSLNVLYVQPCLDLPAQS